MTGAPLRIVVVLKTAEGGLWTVPHIKELCRRGHRVVAVLPPGGRLRAELHNRPVPVLDAPLECRFRPTLAPLAGLRFCPTGGIGIDTAPSYLALPNVACVGGSWVAPRDAVAAGDWSRIEHIAGTAAALKRS